MKKTLLIFLTSAVTGFGQQFETRLLTETVEAGGGIQYFGSYHGGTNSEFQTKLLSGMNRYVSLFGEYSYSQVGAQTIYPGPVEGVRQSFMEMGGGVQVHYSGYRVQPYLLVGLASVRDSRKVFIGAAEAVGSNYQFAYDLGGGVRLFATKHFGFSAEAKTVRGTGGAGQLFNQFSLSAFFQQSAPRW